MLHLWAMNKLSFYIAVTSIFQLAIQFKIDITLHISGN